MHKFCAFLICLTTKHSCSQSMQVLSEAIKCKYSHVAAHSKKGQKSAENIQYLWFSRWSNEFERSYLLST